MFTGIIEELGDVTAWERTGDAARITVHAPLAVSDASHGDSISVSGAAGPVVHPWYLLWGGVVLAATRLGRRSMEAMIWVSLFLVTYGVVDATLANGTWALGVTVAVWMLVRMLLQRRGTDPGDPTDLLDRNRDLRAVSRQRSTSSALG